MAGIHKEYLKDHKHFRKLNKNIIVMFPLIAVVVAIVVFWCLKLVGITVTSEALCNLEAHSHNVTCYEGDELVCAKPEHRHSSDCFPQKGVDVETSIEWKKTFEDVALTDDVAENLVAIAFSQSGYKESAENYEYNALAQKHSYTRYGEWYGTPYGEWNTLFVSFCLNYANINDSDSLISASAESMRHNWEKKNLYFSADEYTGERGDVVFFNTDSDKDADRTAIVLSKGGKYLLVIEGDVDGEVKTVGCSNKDDIMGFGKTSELYAAKHISSADNDKSDTSINMDELSGRVIRYIPNSAEQVATFRMMRSASNEPLVVMDEDDQDIIYTSHLEDEVVGVVFREQSGVELGNGDTVYLGEIYQISLEFSEINTGSEWIQFRHNAEGYLTYQLPSNIHCEPFDDWHTISAKTENGTVEDVGEYFMDENGLLRVKFYKDANGVNFVDKYSNVDFSIDFNASVASLQPGTSTEIKFNDKININMNVDGNASMKAQKTHGMYDSTNHTMEYTIKVEATHGVVTDLVLDDQIWENHHTLLDSVVVTDLNGNLLDPQPTVSANPGTSGGKSGSIISGFPDMPAGQGFIIKYKTQIDDSAMSGETVSMWNGAYFTGKNSVGNEVKTNASDWLEVELEKMTKEGKQVTIKDANGNDIQVIQWEVEIRKDNHDLQGTVVIDTLGEGLEYYTGKPIQVKHYDYYGNALPDTQISWNDVTITNNNSMSFALPNGYAFKIVYYTTFEAPENGGTKSYSNRIKATINGREESASGSADVVGFVTHVSKTASGNDGEYVYFKFEADVPGTIKDWGNFMFTDHMGIWSFAGNDEGFLYVENKPEDLVVKATTASGQVITFTPYVEGESVENTYILVAPATGDLEHSFNIYFNTATPNNTSSKWILAEDSVLSITYKIPFDAKTGTQWTGELKGDLTIEDVLFQEYRLANEAYLDYTNITNASTVAFYEYAPQIVKKSNVNESGVIDYTVSFNNNIPGQYGDKGYINSSVNEFWFNDTFDERLEYVPGSLVVTTYSPWQKGLWVTKYQYNGTVTGNTIRVDAGAFTLIDYNEEATAYWWEWISTAPIFRNYYQWVSAGGIYEFTYQLKVKDEYLYTTDFAKFELDNTAELTWGEDNTSGPDTETSVFYTGLLHKHVVQHDERLDFEVHINRESLDILEGADTLTIQDTMTPNLSVYWDTIRLTYENENGEMIDFTSPESKYTYTVTYSPVNNSLTFIVPDSLHIIIDYTTLITESGLVSVENAVLVDGKAEVADVIDAVFRVQHHSGDASGSNQKITLLKQDGMTNLPLANATFLLYGPKGDSTAVRPAGVPQTIVTDTGKTLRYIGSYTTGEYGTVPIETQYLTFGGPYALVEHIAPEGYEKFTEPVYFYFYDNDPNGIMQTVTTLIAIENFNGGFIIPETGGMGTFDMAIIGIALVALPVLYSLIRRKYKRRIKG